VAAVVAAAGVAGAVGYAGGGAAALLDCLLRDGGVVAAWLAAAAGYGAAPLRLLMRRSAAGPNEAFAADGLGTPRPPSLLTVVSAVAVGLGVLGLLALGLGLAGMLTQASAIALLAAGWLGNVAWLRRGVPLLRAGAGRDAGPPARTDPVSEPMPAPPAHAGWRWLWLLAAPPLAAALAAAVVPPGLLWKPEEPHGFDAIAYHLQVPREWFEAGRIVPLHHNVFSYFPFGVEVHYLLAMHLKGGPWDGMYVAQLMHVALTALAVAAAYGVARQLTLDRRAATVASVAFATVPFLAQLAPLAFNEGGLLLYGALSVGWALVGVGAAGRRDEGRRMKDEGEARGAADGAPSAPSSAFSLQPSALPSFVLAGLMAGFACGVKLTGVPLFLAAVPAAVFAVLVRRSPRQAVSGAAAVAMAGTLVFAPWLVRTVVWSGNPVFPEGSAVFGQAHFTDAQVERWHRAHAPQPDQQPVAARLAAFGGQVAGNWQFGYLLLPAGVAAMGLTWRRPEARVLALLFGAQAAFWLGMTHLQGRFFVPALPLAAAAVALAPWSRLAAGRRAAVGGRATAAVPGAMAALVAAAAVWGWWGVHGRLSGTLAGLRSDTGADARSAILAVGSVDWLEADVWDVFPKDDPAATLTLVGDAQVFWYSLPMTRLRYRTPFDVPQDAGGTVVDGYAAADRGPAAWLRVAPAEVERFAKTYQPFPRIPERVRQTPRWSAEPPVPYVLPPGTWP
jgi:hypothetical protein